jgi:hypothetical protein
VHVLEQSIQLAQGVGRSLGDQEVHGFRQPPQDDDDHRARGEAAEDEDRAPAIDAEEHGGDAAANGCADGVASSLQRD